MPIPCQPNTTPYCDITITTNTNLSYLTGDFIKLTCSTCDYILAQVVSYNPSTGSLTFTPYDYVGSGTCCSWTINLSGESGVSGTSGTSGESGISIGTVLYLNQSQNSDISGYQVASPIPTATTTQTVTTALAAYDTDILVTDFITPQLNRSALARSEERV